ncbi:MAG: GNAT family N-acetyltransferase [Thermodesulfobacteriota bacterium]
MKITTRTAEVTDAPAVAELLRALELFPHIHAQQPEVVVRQVTRNLELCKDDDSHSVYLAQDQRGKLVGYCAVHWLPYLMFSGPEGYISELFLLDSARGLGIGGLLLETIKEEARNRGCSRLMLLNLRDRESYQRGFYKKQGWEERPEAANFIFHLKDLP